MITFGCQACGEVMMFGDVAHRMMEIMGKEAAERGVITVEQLPGAIARLRAAITADRAADRPEDEDGGEGEEGPRVGLAQRALPLVELLERAREEKVPVLWGT